MISKACSEWSCGYEAKWAVRFYEGHEEVSEDWLCDKHVGAAEAKENWMDTKRLPKGDTNE